MFLNKRYETGKMASNKENKEGDAEFFNFFPRLIKKYPRPILNFTKVKLITDFFLTCTNYRINWELIQFRGAWFVKLATPECLGPLTNNAA